MIGRTLAHYTILARIGSGGMGDVYRARDSKLDRDIALKMLPALLIVVGPPLLAGLRGWPILAYVWIAGFASLAVITTVSEAPGYDMHGFGLHLFGGAATLAALALGVGLLLARRRTSRDNA